MSTHDTTSAPLAPARTHRCPACDRGGYACELPRDHVGPHRVTFGADDEGPIPDRVWDDKQLTHAPADDQRVAEIRAFIEGQEDFFRKRPGRMSRSTQHCRYLLDRLDALAARTAELERENAELHGEVAAYRETRTAEVIADLQAQLAAAREEIKKEKQRTDKAVGWLASAYRWTELVDPEKCPEGSNVYDEAAKLLNAAREDSTLIDALAKAMAEHTPPPGSVVGRGQLVIGIDHWADRGKFDVGIAGAHAEDHETIAGALRAALRQLTDRHEETRHADT